MIDVIFNMWSLLSWGCTMVWPEVKLFMDSVNCEMPEVKLFMDDIEMDYPCLICHSCGSKPYTIYRFNDASFCSSCRDDQDSDDDL